MSEAKSTENSIMETDETYCESAEKDESMNTHMSSLNESQDFQLVDSGDESQTQSLLSDAKRVNKNEEKEAAPSSANEQTGGNQIQPEIDKDKSKESEDTPKTKEAKSEAEEKDVSDTCTTKSKTKEHEDSEEVVQCTLSEILFSPKKEDLKRKANSMDAPPRKILRTTSREDALIIDKGRIEEETQARIEVNDIVLPESNVIIAETQDVEEDEAIPSSQPIEDKMDEITKDENAVLQKHYEVDKNENLSTPEKKEEIKTDLVETEVLHNNTKPMENKQEEKRETEPVKVEEKLNATINHEKQEESPKSVEDTSSEKNSVEVPKELEEVTKNSDKSNEEITKNSDKSNEEITKNSDKSIEEATKISNKSIEEATKNNDKSIEEVTKKACNSRMSIEVIYDKTECSQDVKPPSQERKLKEVVEIDEDGEKIVLDSSQEDSDLKQSEKHDYSKADTTYKSCIDSKSSSDYSYKSIPSTKESSLDSKSDNRLVNGSTDSKRCDTDSTGSLQSDTFTDFPGVHDKVDSQSSSSSQGLNKLAKVVLPAAKETDNLELLSVSENDTDMSLGDDKNKSDSTHSNSLARALQVEREVSMYVRLKCLLHMDESTKECISKEVTAVYCDPTSEPTLIRQKTNDTSSSLADISDNKDGSPGSVMSNAQLFPLNPSRLSCASTISSLSSVSSAASLAAKIALRDNAHFSLPRAPVKHTKKCYHDMLPSADKQTDDSYERLTKEWHNNRLLTTTILSFANAELSGVDTYNVSHDRLDEQLQKIRSSTPEAPKVEAHPPTPKSTKRGKAAKRPRTKRTDAQSNGIGKISPKVLIPSENSGTPRKKNKTEHETIAGSAEPDEVVKPIPQVAIDELVGREAFAKWSDNNYYPGTVIDKVKTKYKVNFYDGKNKVLIEDFIIPIPDTLTEGLSVYATTKNDDYGSCGIIVDCQRVDGEVYYTVETDEGEKLKVQVQDIFLSSDQAQVLKEDGTTSLPPSLPSTPKHLAQVTLDNVLDGKRRSRRIATPSVSSPKTRGFHTPLKSSSVAEPSVSGVASKIKKEKKGSENEGASSDSNISIKEETLFGGVQPEIIGTPNVLDSKGPQSRIKSKARSKKKAEDEETIATLGPIPANSTLFKGMSFVLTCASLETIDRYQSDMSKGNTGSEPETEIEEEWVKKPFVRERLRTQITAGGGKVYDEFVQIPEDEYKTTKLISNVPNTTAKALLCLSIGIPVYSHNWIIRCCQENKIVNCAEDGLPAGWSLEKQSYVEMFERPSSKPLEQAVVIIPVLESERKATSFWRQICENAGAVVILAEKPELIDSFGNATMVLANHRSPSWVIDRAHELEIPLVSTTYIVQCLVEGKSCSHDAQPRYAYNYVTN